MNLRKLASLAVLLALTLSTSPTTAAGDACAEALRVFQDAFIASGFELTAENAASLSLAVRACGNVPSTVDTNQLLDPVTTAGRPIIARDCGATAIPPLNAQAADITVTYQVLVPALGPVGPTVKVERDQGPATATFDPNSNLTTYTTRSTNASLEGITKWGLDAWNSGNVVTDLPQAGRGYGIIYLYGVPIPAAYINGWGNARAGCTEQTLGTVCWAEGTATVTLTTAIWLNVRGGFSRC